MKTRNCPNCGAPYDMNLNKCPYCGTSYYDMSALDFSSTEPFYLKIRYNGTCITQLVKPDCNISMEFQEDSVDVVGRHGDKIISFSRGAELVTNISFNAVRQPNGEMLTIEKQEQERIL